MTPAPPLSARSLARLEGVHPDLVRVILHAAADGASFIVTEGRRSPDRQAMLVAAGKSRTLNSRHIHGFAVDLAVTTPDGGVSWRRDDYRLLAVTVKEAARTLGIPLTWGGDWVSFVDCPHFELPRHFYPDPPVDLSPVPTTTSIA